MKIEFRKCLRKVFGVLSVIAVGGILFSGVQAARLDPRLQTQIAGLAADPPGGVVDRDPATGRPLGPIREYGATHLVLAKLGSRPESELPDAMRVVQARYAAAGITAVRVTGLRPGDLAVYQALLRTDGRLANRVFGGPRIDPTLDRAGYIAWLRSNDDTHLQQHLIAIRVFTAPGRCLAANRILGITVDGGDVEWSGSMVTTHAPDGRATTIDVFPHDLWADALALFDASPDSASV